MVMYVVTDLLGMVQVHFTSLVQVQALGGDDGEANVDTVEEEDRLQRHLPAFLPKGPRCNVDFHPRIACLSGKQGIHQGINVK